MSFQVMENFCNAESIPVRLYWPFENCEKFDKNKKTLNEHFRLYPSHESGTLSVSRPSSCYCQECSENFLADETNPYTRKSACLTDEELEQLALSRIINTVTSVEFLFQGTRGANEVRQKLFKFKNGLWLGYPEFTSLFCQRPPTDTREKLVTL